MGNKPISVGLRTDQDSYTAGDTITGRVYLSISNDGATTTPISIQTLQLRLVGEEFALIHHTTTEHNNDGRRGDRRRTTTREENHYEESSFVFFSVDYPLHTGQLPPGQYEYPFSIHLPQHLPSTMFCRDGQSYCKVAYELVATLHKASGGGIFNSHPQEKQQVTICAAVPPPSVHPGNNSLQLPMEQVPVTRCCCIRKGIMALESRLDKTLVQPQDVMEVQFRCQNQSTVKVHTIRVQLEQIIEWKCHMHQKQVTRILDARDFHAHQYPELDHLSKSERRRRRGQNRYFGTPQEEAPFTALNWHVASLQIPSNANDSYQGRAVQVRHVFSVLLLTKGCCTSNPDISTRIQIVRSVPRMEEAAAAASPMPSAPLDTLDSVEVDAWAPSSSAAAPHADYYDHQSSSALPMAEAQVLPDDWNAQTADVVEIPMARAIVLEPQVKF